MGLFSMLLSDACIKNVEPNYGRIVTLQIDAEDIALQLIMDIYISYADQINAKTTVSENKITFECKTFEDAEIFRKKFV